MNSLIKPLFWSYSNKNVPKNIYIEHILKYGDLKEIFSIINDYGKENCAEIWLRKIISDSRFERLNYFLARYIFKISNNKNDILNYIKSHKQTRFE